MSNIITFAKTNQAAGFTPAQFRHLDQIYCRAAAEKILTYRSVECDFDEGVASYTYYQNSNAPPHLQFVIRQVGPRTVMYEVFKIGKGRIVKTGLFDRAIERLEYEIHQLGD